MKILSTKMKKKNILKTWMLRLNSIDFAKKQKYIPVTTGTV
jgi:hypothetical protein